MLHVQAQEQTPNTRLRKSPQSIAKENITYTSPMSSGSTGPEKSIPSPANRTNIIPHGPHPAESQVGSTMTTLGLYTLHIQTDVSVNATF